MAFTTNPYCVLTDVQNMLNLPSYTTADTTVLDYLIPQAQQAIDDFLGYSFQTDGTALSPAMRQYSGNGTASLIINRCVQLTQVLQAPYVVTLGTYSVMNVTQATPLDITSDCVLQDISSYRQYGNIMNRISGLLFEHGVNNYTVYGVFGVPSIPVTITRACALLTVHFYRLRDVGYSQTIAQAGNKQSPGAINRSWPKDVLDLLAPYRRPTVFG